MNVTLYMILLVSTLLFITYLTFFIVKKILKMPEGGFTENFFSGDDIEVGGKMDCLNRQVYCFNDADCFAKCFVKTTMACFKGMCTDANIIRDGSDPIDEDDCRYKDGRIRYFMGNIAWGKWDVVCKSTDPGISYPTGPNRMCFDWDTNTNIHPEIDYSKHVPDADDCKCDTLCVIPATEIKRRHVECNTVFHDYLTL